MKLDALPQDAYSYRQDADVPDFDDAFALAVMDGECALCSRGASFIARHDRHQNIKICAIKGTLGSALARHYDIDPDDPQSWIFIRDGKAHVGFEGFIQTGLVIGGVWKIGIVAKTLPLEWRQSIYAWIATNRIKWFGRGDLCSLPDPELRARLILD